MMTTVLIAGCRAARCADARDSWRVATDDTAVVIAIRQGAPVMTRLGSAKDASNWVLQPVPEALFPSVIQHGISTPIHWDYAGGTLDPATGQLVLEFSNAARTLKLKSIWRARPGRGPVEHWLTLANHTGSAITIGHQDSLALGGVALPSTESLDAWWVRRGGGNAAKEGGTFVRSVGRHSNEVITSDPTDGASPVPWLALQAGTSHGLYVGWEFSGVGRIHWQGNSPSGVTTDRGIPAQLAVEVGNVPDFKTDVPDGETFLVPPAFVGCYLGDIDDGSYSLHRFVMEKLLPRFPQGYDHPTLAYNPYVDNEEMKATEESELTSAALARELGFETFVVDASWFPQSGDWRWDPQRFPRGARPIAAYLHRHSMKFGLWMAYTQGSDSDDAAALNFAGHRNWFTAPYRFSPKQPLHWGALIDLGFDPARAWATEMAERAVSDYHLDYFKTDYSPIVTHCDQSNHRHHYGTDVSYWSTLGYYAVQDALLRKFPNLILEGCSDSGHIKDFGNIQRVHTIAMSDTLSSLPNRQAIYDSTFPFPPAALMDYTFENRYDTVSDAPEPYLWRSSMMNWWQIAPTHSAIWTRKQRDQVKRATDIFKSWIRPMLADAEVRHILPRPDGFHWDGMFYWSPSLRRGTLYIFRPNSDRKSQIVPLKGLEAKALYQVSSEDKSTAAGTYTGEALMNTGLKIELPGPYTSDLVYLTSAAQ